VFVVPYKEILALSDLCVGALSRQSFNLLQIIRLYFGIFPAFVFERSHDLI
jgi:hypothetical protein